MTCTHKANNKINLMWLSPSPFRKWLAPFVPIIAHQMNSFRFVFSCELCCCFLQWLVHYPNVSQLFGRSDIGFCSFHNLRMWFWHIWKLSTMKSNETINVYYTNCGLAIRTLIVWFSCLAYLLISFVKRAFALIYRVVEQHFYILFESSLTCGKIW